MLRSWNLERNCTSLDLSKLGSKSTGESIFHNRKRSRFSGRYIV